MLNILDYKSLDEYIEALSLNGYYYESDKLKELVAKDKLDNPPPSVAAVGRDLEYFDHMKSAVDDVADVVGKLASDLYEAKGRKHATQEVLVDFDNQFENCYPDGSVLELFAPIKSKVMELVDWL